MAGQRPARSDVRLGVRIFAVASLLALAIVVFRLAIPESPAPTPVVATIGALTGIAAPSPAVARAPATPTPAVLALAATPAASYGRRRPIVCLDPGHGGADLGNVRLDNNLIALREKDLTLATALALASRLRSDGFDVVLTRTTDAEVNPDNRDVNGDGTVAPSGGDAQTDQLDDLQARVNFCNAAHADLLLSIHYNGAANHALAGYEVWYNDHRTFSDRNLAFANMLHDALGAAYAGVGYQANDRGIGADDLAVLGPARPGKLVPSAMPGALVEGLFLSNDQDAQFIMSEHGLATIVGADEAAIKAYFAKYPV
ncbi:MAG TPA: N-acetylmuramoyl-L-alanine amidase [Thermomicrobiales bacterium]|jgi:N-acetylmuramoyl-L-alanine amidase|nr:N-acetylmuramoyl-L-alanine amidase [Thermomicrobiales bacterium]